MYNGEAKDLKIMEMIWIIFVAPDKTANDWTKTCFRSLDLGPKANIRLFYDS